MLTYMIVDHCVCTLRSFFTTPQLSLQIGRYSLPKGERMVSTDIQRGGGGGGMTN